MEIIKGDIWDYHNDGKTIAITTNGNTRMDGKAVMGKGIALQARNKFPQLPVVLAEHLHTMGNIPIYINSLNIVTFPTKKNYYEKSNLSLILVGLGYLQAIAYTRGVVVYSPIPGVGNGQLEPELVVRTIKNHVSKKLIKFVVNDDRIFKEAIQENNR